MNESELAEGKKREMQGFVQTIEEAIEERKHLLDSKKDEVEHKIKERSANSKNLKKVEDSEYKTDGELIFLDNRLKKLENQVRGY